MSFTIRSQNSGNTKSNHPREEKISDTGLISYGAQQSHMWPTYCPVNHVHEEVSEAIAGGKRSHKIQMNMVEPSIRNRGDGHRRRNRDGRHRSTNNGFRSCSAGNRDRLEINLGCL